MEFMAISGAASGATEYRQNLSSAPHVSTIGSLDAPMAATADADTRPDKDLPKTPTSNTLEPSVNLSRDGNPSQHRRDSSTTRVGSGRDSAQHQISRDGVTPERYPNPIGDPSTAPGPEIRSARSATFAINGHMNDTGTSRKMGDDKSSTAPGSKTRSKTPARPRGLGRSRGGGSGGATGRKTKRKRENDDDDDASDSSEVYTPVATTTKSGRSIQKPTSYVPPPPPQSPASNSKRKRSFRKNPESAVCKICLRGTSPAGNVIVFCDGCNTPYHRYCHHPPISQEAVDEVDMEWYCRQCEKRNLAPVADSEVADFVSAEGISVEQRRKYFSRLRPGMLVTLLTRATTLQPGLPLFAPEFVAKHNRPKIAEATSTKPTDKVSDGPLHVLPGDEDENSDDNEGYDPSFHPPNYPKPGQGLLKTLPPDKDDVQWLVDDDDDSGAFTHIYQDNSNAAGADIETPGVS